MTAGKNRLAHVDGLRGLAVGMVLLIHSSAYALYAGPHHVSPWQVAFLITAGQGYEGVTLFLVLSGFCLSYPAFSRRARGQSGWFDVRDFARRRCWRILPPYYAALVLSIALTYLDSSLVGPRPNLLNVLAHVALIQNMTPYFDSINGPFWSLGLEWQWYAVFPVILYGVLRWPRRTLLACFAIASVWHLGTHDWGFRFDQVSVVLPGRLFEFACGVVAARIVASGWVPSRRAILLLAWIVSAPLSLVAPTVVELAIARYVGPVQPFVGLSFAALLLLATYSRKVRALFSWRPLAALGLVSYSVYLMHRPAIYLVQPFVWSLTHDWVITSAVGYAIGVAAGLLFFWVVERHFLQYPFSEARSAHGATSERQPAGWTAVAGADNAVV